MTEFLRVAAPVMGFVCLVLTCLCVTTKLGKMKVFQFVIGEFATLTAIAYGYLMGSRSNWFYPVLAGIWFVVASLKFWRAAFSATE
jgi:hypothetical protein